MYSPSAAGKQRPLRSSYSSTHSKLVISMNNLEDALLNVAMGRTKKSFVVTDKVKRETAYHEGAHALVALLTPGANEIRKATILARGPALGMVSLLNSESKIKTKKEYLADMKIAMAGTAAEELIFGSDGVSSGAASDIHNATSVAYDMVSQYGMSDAVGHVSVDEQSNKVDIEVRRMLDEAYKDAMELLKRHRRDLDTLAQALIKYETLDKSEIQRVLKGESLPERESLFNQNPHVALL